MHQDVQLCMFTFDKLKQGDIPAKLKSQDNRLEITMALNEADLSLGLDDHELFDGSAL